MNNNIAKFGAMFGIIVIGMFGYVFSNNIEEWWQVTLPGFGLIFCMYVINGNREEAKEGK